MKTKPNYKAFAKDLMKLCAKHGVRLSACHMGNVFLGSASTTSRRHPPGWSWETPSTPP